MVLVEINRKDGYGANSTAVKPILDSYTIKCADGSLGKKQQMNGLRACGRPEQ